MSNVPATPEVISHINIGVITALPKEWAAVCAMLVEPREWLATGRGAGRRYMLGKIPSRRGASHAVAVALLPDTGNNVAAIRASQLLQHIPDIQHVVMCGIAGGVFDRDKRDKDVRLGDIVVSNRNGIIQYDFGVQYPNGVIEHRHPPRPPSAELLEAVRHLEGERLLQHRPWEMYIQQNANRLEDSERPNDHVNADGSAIEYPEDPARNRRMPRVFSAPIASANSLLKDATKRQALLTSFGTLAVEMEGSGVADATWIDGAVGYLVVRGICDYCDEHKGDAWQAYASLCAAAYVRALVESIPTTSPAGTSSGGSSGPSTNLAGAVVSNSLVVVGGDSDATVAATPFQRLWNRLRTAVPPIPETRIAIQPWREIQPNVEEIVRDRAMGHRVVFASEGGIGKSRLLGALHGEQVGTRIWVDTLAPLQHLEEALAFGAQAVHSTGEPLTIFVDAIEQVASPAELLGTIERALVVCDRAVVYAATRLATWNEIRDRLAGWRGVRLAPWSDDRIRVLAQAGRTEPLSADLIDLLRTPLLLELFLRTFASGNVVPAGLATRHGVLRAYFERRVYVSAMAARRAGLDAGVAAVLANRATWRDVTPAADQLTSEGIVMATFGELRFRHALLRDFSAALQLVSRTAEEIAAALRDVVNPVVRNELLRGVIEAQLDPDAVISSPSIEELVRECTRHELAAGIALGTTDAPTPALLAAIAPIEGGTVLRQAMAHARLIDNRAWLRVPGALGGTRPAWFGEAQLHAMADLAEFGFATGDTASAALASTLRTWTSGHRISGDVAWSFATIGALLVRSLPDDATARWYENLELGDTSFKGRFLEQLRDLAGSPSVDDAVLSGALDKLVFGAGSHVLDGGHSLWEVTSLCLSDYDGNSGMLTTRPRVALALLFRLSVARELEEDRRRRSIRTDSAVTKWFANLPPPPAELLEAEARLRIEPTLSEAEALGDLVDDVPSPDRHTFDYVETLIEEVAQRAAEEVTFAEILATVAIASRSVRARIIVLSLRGSPRIDGMSTEIIRDPRMYHVQYASGALWDAIHVRWPVLTPEARTDVQKNILARAQSPLLSFIQVGRLASAIPRESLEPALQPYVEFLEASGRPTAPTRPARVEAFSGDVGDDDSESHVADARWQRFETLASTENDQVASKEAVAMLRAGAADLATDTSDSIWFGCGSFIAALDGSNLDHLTSLSLGREDGTGLGMTPSA